MKKQSNMSEKLPKRFVILRDADNPMWDKYIEWLNEKTGNRSDGSWICYYGLDDTALVAYQLQHVELANYTILTLEQWDAIVNPKEYAIQYICDKPKGQLSIYDIATNEMLTELKRAKGLFPDRFANQHEGIAVLWEEVDELWDEVKKNQKKYDLVNQRKEALQVAAMAIRFAAELTPMAIQQGDTVCVRKDKVAESFWNEGCLNQDGSIITGIVNKIDDDLAIVKWNSGNLSFPWQLDLLQLA